MDIFAGTKAAMKIYILEKRLFHPFTIAVGHFAPAGLNESHLYPMLRLHSDRHQQG